MAEQESEDHTGSWRVLVVDDEFPIARALGEILNREIYQVMIAMTGEEAVRRTTEWRLDLVLSDILMPGMDGIKRLHNNRQIASELQGRIAVGARHCS